MKKTPLEIVASLERRRLLTASTAYLHRLALVRWGEQLGHPPRLRDYGDDQVAEFGAARLRSGRSRATVRGEQCKLLAQWRHAHTLGWLRVGPTIQPVAAPPRLPTAWDRDQLAAIFRQARKRPDSEWWVALLSVLWDTGARVGEATAVEWGDLDLRRCWIVFRAETTKTHVDRMAAISRETADALAALPRNLPPLRPRCDRQTLYNRFRAMLRAAGLPTDRRSMFHRIRRSFASHLEAAGGDATSALGHSSRRVTVASYLDPSVCGGPAPVTRLFRP